MDLTIEKKIPGYLKVFGRSALLFIDVNAPKRCEYVVLKNKTSTKVELASLLHIEVISPRERRINHDWL